MILNKNFGSISELYKCLFEKIQNKIKFSKQKILYTNIEMNRNLIFKFAKFESQIL